MLEKLNPLKHVATVRKSQVQHALAEMLTSMLAHSVAVDEPRCVAQNQRGRTHIRACGAKHRAMAACCAAHACSTPPCLSVGLFQLLS